MEQKIISIDTHQLTWYSKRLRHLLIQSAKGALFGVEKKDFGPSLNQINHHSCLGGKGTFNTLNKHLKFRNKEKQFYMVLYALVGWRSAASWQSWCGATVNNKVVFLTPE